MKQEEITVRFERTLEVMLSAYLGLSILFMLGMGILLLFLPW